MKRDNHDVIDTVEQVKNKVLKTSTKGFGYFAKNVGLILLIMLAFYIIGNFQTFIQDPKHIIDIFLNTGWQILIVIFVVVTGIYQLARSIIHTDTADSYDKSFKTYQRIEEDIEKKKNDEHKEGIDKRIQNTPLINNEMKDLIIDLGADRTLILEMHNGTNNLNGLPFVSFDATYEDTAPNIEYVSDQFKNFNMSRYPFIGSHFNEGIWLGSQEDVEKEDPRLASVLKFVDTSYLACMVIEGVDGPLGFLIVAFKTTEDIPTKSKIIQKLNKSVQILSRLLDKKSFDK